MDSALPNAPVTEVALLDDSQKRAAATTLARAFFEDPGYAYVFPRDSARRAGLDFIYARVVDMLQPLGATLALREPPGRSVLAVAAWVPPRRAIHPIQLLCHGLLKVPFLFGVGTARRLLECFDFMDRARAVVMEGRPHWFLDHLGVDPRCQGSGLGSRLLREAIASLSAREALPCMLFTAKARNVPFYVQAGFAVKREDVVGARGGFRMWSLVREPTPLRGGGPA